MKIYLTRTGSCCAGRHLNACRTLLQRSQLNCSSETIVILYVTLSGENILRNVVIWHVRSMESIYACEVQRAQEVAPFNWSPWEWRTLRARYKSLRTRSACTSADLAVSTVEDASRDQLFC